MKDFILLKTFADCEEVSIDAIYKRIRKGTYPSDKVVRVSRPVVGGYQYLLNIYLFSSQGMLNYLLL